jgi:CubicO group peptidase (beta-lactamase class C family)
MFPCTRTIQAGLLFLVRDNDGKQIISRRWVEEATRCRWRRAEDVDPYGYGWWIVPEIEGVYRADGRGGQYIFVLPQWNMIVVTTGGGFEMDEIGEQILASISDFEEPLPANPEGVARWRSHRRRRSTARARPVASS